MDANELRALQAPLKKQYREQPATALTPARAEAMLDVDRIACRVRSWGVETDAGLHPATGGDGSLACSADIMLEALVACAGVTVSAVATAMGVKLRGGRVAAEGHWDARGTLGVDREAPVGLTDIALKFELDPTPIIVRRIIMNRKELVAAVHAGTEAVLQEVRVTQDLSMELLTGNV